MICWLGPIDAGAYCEAIAGALAPSDRNSSGSGFSQDPVMDWIAGD